MGPMLDSSWAFCSITVIRFDSVLNLRKRDKIEKVNTLPVVYKEYLTSPRRFVGSL